MKRTGRIILSLIIITVLSAAFSPADAVVVMNADSAMRSDNFVGHNSSAGTAKSKKSQQLSARKENIAKAKLDAAHTLSATRSDKDEIKIYDTDGKLVDTITRANSAAKKEEAEHELQQLNSEIQESYQEGNPSAEVNRHYASKLFSTLSGYITIEEDDIPRKIAVTPGSLIQLNLESGANRKWFLDIDEKIAKVKKERIEGGKKIIVLEAVGKGSTRLRLDYLSVAAPDYKLLRSKRLLIMVK